MYKGHIKASCIQCSWPTCQHITRAAQWLDSACCRTRTVDWFSIGQWNYKELNRTITGSIRANLVGQCFITDGTFIIFCQITSLKSAIHSHLYSKPMMNHITVILCKQWCYQPFVVINIQAVFMVVSVALLVAHWTNNQKVVGSMPANVVCITVLTGNRLG